MNEELIEFLSPYLTSIFGAYSTVIIAVAVICYAGLKVIKDTKAATGSLKNSVDMSGTNKAINELTEANKRLLDELKEQKKTVEYLRFRVDEINKKVGFDNEK